MSFPVMSLQEMMVYLETEAHDEKKKKKEQAEKMKETNQVEQEEMKGRRRIEARKRIRLLSHTDRRTSISDTYTDVQQQQQPDEDKK